VDDFGIKDVLAILIALVAGRLAVMGSNEFQRGDKRRAGIYGVGSVVVFWSAVLLLKYWG
jgi:hypothetical protein